MINSKQLEKVREEIVEIVRDPSYMFNDNIRSFDDRYIDLISVITSLYNELHEVVTGERYDYFFHHANKCGSGVNELRYHDFFHCMHCKYKQYDREENTDKCCLHKMDVDYNDSCGDFELKDTYLEYYIDSIFKINE